MKKLLSLLGTLGILTTASSAVVSCGQEIKKAHDDNNQKPDPNPGEGKGDENEGGNTEEPAPDPEPEEKISIVSAFPETELGFIHIEAESLPHFENIQKDKEIVSAFNISRQIIKNLLEKNNQGKTAEEANINPFELYVNIPTLIDHQGTMKAIVEVLNSSKTHKGQIEVTFTIDLDIKFLILQTDLGILSLGYSEFFDIVNGRPLITNTYLHDKITMINPQLNKALLDGKIKRKDDSLKWNEPKNC